MSEVLDIIIDDTTGQMKKAISHLESELSKIRAGKATPQIVEGIYVDYYGASTPLNQVANVNCFLQRLIFKSTESKDNIWIKLYRIVVLVYKMEGFDVHFKGMFHLPSLKISLSLLTRAVAHPQSNFPHPIRYLH